VHLVLVRVQELVVVALEAHHLGPREQLHRSRSIASLGVCKAWWGSICRRGDGLRGGEEEEEEERLVWPVAGVAAGLRASGGLLIWGGVNEDAGGRRRCVWSPGEGGGDGGF
jgi:hypothetical protein